MMIDDFTSGDHNRAIEMGMDRNTQPTGNPDFPYRTTTLIIASPSSRHTGTIDVGYGDLSIATAPRMYHRLEVVYGLGESGVLEPLNQDLNEFTGFRVNFLLNDRKVLNFNIVYFTDSGWAASGRNIPEILYPNPVDFPFEDFGGPGAGQEHLGEVNLIVLIAQTGSLGGANDYCIDSFEVY